MTATASVAGRPAARPRRAALGWAALVGAALLVAVVAGRPPEAGRPYDPDGVGPLGGRALVLLLQEYGAEVDVTDELPGLEVPPGRDDVVLVLVDDLGPDQRDDLEGWVAAGGRAVVADPASPLTPSVSGSLPLGAAVDADVCDIEALADVGALDPGPAVTYRVPAGAASCHGTSARAFVVAEARGAGALVALGGPDLVTNERLAELDNAVLAVALLAPRDGSRVVWLTGSAGAPAEGTGDLWSLVSPGWRAALLQLAVAGVLYVVARGRRLGRPVSEPAPVTLAGSELVLAVGRLLQQRRDPAAAARLLRDQTRRVLAARLGLGPDAPVDALVDVLATRTGVDPAGARAALADTPVATEADLVALARQLAAIRQEVLHGAPP